MPKKFQKNRGPKIRRGQVITTFGPGALVNLENGSFIGVDIEGWPNLPATVIYEDRLQKLLKVSYFRQPPSGEEYEAGIAYRRFPSWLFCPKCRKLKPYQKWERQYDNKRFPLRCPDCRMNLVPMSFLVACRRGHIDDFPWIEWVHRNRPCQNPDLKYTTTLAGAGLESSQIECKACDARRSMQGAYSEDAFNFKCRGSSPWTKNNRKQDCSERLITVQRGASNVYFPNIVSSITIPPYTDLLLKKIRETPQWQAFATAEGAFEMSESVISVIAERVSAAPAEVKKKVDFLLGKEEADKTPEKYRFEEYLAFHGEYDSESNDSADFRVVPGNEGYDYSKFNIKDVFMVKSLREVRALVGFTRLKPYERDEENGEVDAEQKSELVALTDRPGKSATWKPAVEVRGEGVFLTFDPVELEKWEGQNSVQRRMDIINANYKRSCERRGANFQPLNAKYVMLHTFAHLLIRQLAFESGYSGASLRERIYCNRTGSDQMQGILIYTAAGDADGTLGGLVRQAEPDRLPGVLESTLRNSDWCANDPLCIESGGQGYESLNLAACYACALLPETSCEEFNKFLDRALVVGTPEDPKLGYFSNRVGF